MKVTQLGVYRGTCSLDMMTYSILCAGVSKETGKVQAGILPGVPLEGAGFSIVQ